MIELNNRRAMLQRLGGGLGMLGAAGAMTAPQAFGMEAAAGMRGPHFAPKAKRVIHLFMNGGPFQADLFDPKPALKKYEGQRPASADLATERPTGGLLPSPFRFRNCGESGLPVSELLPQLSNHIDDICVLRSMHADNPNHGPALLQMNNGTILPTRPSMGAWFLYGLGTENESLPGYVVLCPGRPVRFSILWNSAFLPSSNQGTYINHSKIEPSNMVPFLRNKRWTADVQRRQLDLLKQLDAEVQNRTSADQAFDARVASMETAFRMQFQASDAFDVEQETKQTREAYGSGHFSNGCLLARRMVERGVRFVQVYYGNGQPWDTHSNHDKAVPKLCQNIDQPIAALLSDLKQRGLLEDTLIIWGGEFGRTPTSENGNGRDHNHHGFTMWMAGGGVKGGMAYGETDEFGFKAAVNKMHVHDMHATVLHLLGLDHERLTYRSAGRDYRLTDVHGRVVHEIIS
ncbi:DUF1501 domain-containing protein [Fuerstiella marisgermanici]|uniref:Sulfatase n=1 Tax=Fuerstiella marisgermanici TaxID=1891926 RepID=A0A1P8WC67_9PLAN|nr:DUF1501 domain-containing protein [Fuerstiella marisgermanici]APZ91658.1 hypothetical protein Fuma_01249 [Fuerstiella marisgermanici]